MREAAGLHFRSGNQRVKKPLSCPVDAVNPIAKISPKKKEKNAKVKTSEISLVYFYLKIDRKFPFFGRQDKCHRKRRNGIGSQQLWKLLATFFPFFSSPRWVLHPKETEKALPEIHVKPDISFLFIQEKEEKLDLDLRCPDREEALQIMAEVPDISQKLGLGWCALLSGSVCCARRLAYSIYRKIRKIVLEDASPSPRSKQRASVPVESVLSVDFWFHPQDSSFSPKSQATDATAAKSADGVQRYRVILSVLRAFDNRQRKTVLSSSNAHSKQERWGKGAKRRERKVQFIESES
ncbi:hypothetical protein L1987_89298 [Smallanthus sonchifolius]|nr:hypothetical protein L1987_89298 [Smallanthus sonchifolius]